MKVYILMGNVQYEGTDILEVFAKEEAAQDALKPLESWVNRRPPFRPYEQYGVWEDKCPRKGCEGYDRYYIKPVDVTE